MLTFAVAAARPGRTVPPWARARLEDAHPGDLTFVPTSHRCWSSDDGRLVVGIWQDADRLGLGPRWEVRPSGLTALSGMCWHRATPWASDRPWAAQLADLLARRPLPDVIDDLDGLFVALSLGADGTGTVAADLLGLSSLYRAEGEDLVVASNRAQLAADLVTPPGRRAERDVEAAAWLVFAASVAEGRTGYRAVRRVPDGSYLAVAPDRPLDVVTYARHPWWSGPPVPAADVEQAIAATGDAVRALLQVHAGLPSRRRAFELTGGHDSRVLLALAVEAGVEHRFSYLTWGSDDLPDVVVASRLAERYALDHSAAGQARPEHRPTPTPGPVEPDLRPYPLDVDVDGLDLLTGLRHHVWSTSGGLSCWDRVRPFRGSTPNVSVSGLFGELLRAFHGGAAGLHDDDEVLPAIEAGRLRSDPAALLHPEVRRELVRRTAALVLDARGPGASIQEAFDGYYLRHRLRPWYGSMEEGDGRHRVFPFASPRVIRGAFSLGVEARLAERLAFTLVEGADPELAREPFAGKGWPSTVVAGRADRDAYPTSDPTPPWLPVTDPGRASRVGEALRQVRARLRPTPPAPPRAPRAPRAPTQGTVLEERRAAEHAQQAELFAVVLDLPRDHVLFDVVDRGAVVRAAAIEHTGFHVRRSLYDLATAAIWQGGTEARVPGAG